MGKVEKKIWYSLENNGDGSAYPKLMESEELCIIDQDNMDEGWGEPCYGYITVTSDSPITIEDEVVTKEMVIKEIEEEIAEEWTTGNHKQRLEEHLQSVKNLKGESLDES